MRRAEQELASACQYEPLPSLPEAELPDLVGGESYEWAAIGDLDAFFKRIYRYWHDKGLVCIVTGRVLNLAALGFTIAFSGLLMLVVNWSAIHAECLMPHERTHSCDLLAVAIHKHPLREHSKGFVLLVGLYLLLCVLYWAWSALQLGAELRDVLDVKHFINNKLGISDRQVRMMTWSELLHRLVLVQGSTRLCAARDLDELDIVGRIMRKENYLIGMLNAGVLGLYVKGLGPLGGRRFMLTKTLEWNLYLCILDPMFDEHFHIRQGFLSDEAALRQRLLKAAVINLLLAPFLLMFLVIYFIMKHAERFYHSPGSLGSRRWSSLAKWKLRELNELPHYIQHRLDASYEAAVKYVAQFPSPLVSLVAKFVAFVAGSFAALLLGLTLLDENLLEVPLGGRNLVWWLALTGILLTISRTFINETPAAFDPERAMAELVLHTHYLPRHWRGRAHSAEVQQSVNSMFTFKVLLFAEELASVVLTPFILAFSLPNCAGAILQFVQDTTTRVEGVGDVCSLAVFDFGRHGNRKYGAPSHADKRMRSKQGKMEKSFLTFVATYPTWQPPSACRQVLDAIGSVSTAAAAAALNPMGAALNPMGPGGPMAGFSYAAGPGFSGSSGPGFGAAAGAGACAGFGPGAELQGGSGESVLWQQHPYSSSSNGAGGVAGVAAGGPCSPNVLAGQQSAAPSGTSSIWVGVAEAPVGLRHPNCPPYMQQHQQQQQQLFSRGVAGSPYAQQQQQQQQQQLFSRGVAGSPYAQQQQQQQQQQLCSPKLMKQQLPADMQHQRQQQQLVATEGMGAGLGGLGSSPPKAAGAAAADTAAAAAPTDALLDALNSPEAAGMGGGTGPNINVQQQQQQQQQQQGLELDDAFADGLFEPLSPQEHSAPAAAAAAAVGSGAAAAAAAANKVQLPAATTAGAAAGPSAALPPLHMQQQQQYQQQQLVSRPHWQQQQQQQQQHNHQLLLLQLSQFSSSLLPGMTAVRGHLGQGGVLQSYPSTLYPGGPNAAAAMSHCLQPPLPLPQQPQPAAARTARQGTQGAFLQPPAGPSVGPGPHHVVAVPSSSPQQQQQQFTPSFQQQQQQQQQFAPAGSFLAANNSLAGSDFLLTNEREDLSSRIAASQSLLQSFYETQDLSVQHRQANVAHARSVLLGQSGSAAAAAAAAAAMAAAASVRLEHM